MDQDKLVGQAVVTVPIIHLITCAIYLAGYSAGFGANIGTIFSVGDLFGLSVSELFWTYLAGVVIPLVALSPQLRPDYKTAHARAQETGDAAIISRIAWQNKVFFRAILGMMALVTLASLFYLFISISLDQRIPYMELSQPFAFIISFGWSSYASKLPTKRTTDLLIAIIMTLALLSFATGLTRGQGERRYPVKSFIDARPSCGGWLVLRTVGERMIALNKDGLRAVITDECKPALLIPRRADFKQAALAELTTEWWRGPIQAKPAKASTKSAPNGNRIAAHQNPDGSRTIQPSQK